VAKTKDNEESVSTGITPKGQATTEAPGTDASGNTTGNTGLTEDVFAESRAKEEAAIKAREEATEAQKVPTEALTDEARAYTEAGDEATAEAEAEWARKVETTETGVPVEAPE
jgi:hypothetical protein